MYDFLAFGLPFFAAAFFGIIDVVIRVGTYGYIVPGLFLVRLEASPYSILTGPRKISKCCFLFIPLDPLPVWWRIFFLLL